jgi:hypothetical protein
VSDNLNQFNDAQLQQISIDVGDTARNLPTNLRYRIQLQENADLEKTEIQGNMYENEYVRKMAELEAEEGGSVGDVEPNNDDTKSVSDVDEVISPSPISVDTSTELDTLYKKLGETQIQLKTLEMAILRKLGAM